MKAVILAAGYATRLYPLTENMPKCLLKVGDKTILDSLCAKLAAVPEIDEIAIVTNAKFAGQLEAWKAGAKLRPKIDILNDGTTSNDTRLGAVGDLGFWIRERKVDDDILMLASDNLFEQGLGDFVRTAKTRTEAITVALYDIGDPMQASKKFGVLEMDAKGLITGMEEKPEFPKSSLIGMGVYYFPRATLKYVHEYLAQKNAKDAPGYYLQWIYQRIQIFGFLFKGLWYDIGDLNALEEAKKIFKGK